MNFRLSLYTCLAVLIPATVSAQAKDSDSAQNAIEGSVSRWLTVDTLSASYRYKNLADFDGFHLFDSGQERFLADAGFKFDAEGKYSINFHLSSGRNFNWAFSDSLGNGFWELITPSRAFQSKAQLARKAAAVKADPVGNASYVRVSRGDEVYMRQLYFRAQPIKSLTLEYGGLPIARGVNTEITTYDDDGYLAGERLRFRDPHHVYFDEIAVTYGYVGDYFNPNLFTRGNRFLQSNYHQFLAEKQFGKRVKASADYTWQNGVHVMREAAVADVAESRAFSAARLELYQRLNDITLQGATFSRANGFSVGVIRNLYRRVNLEAGFAAIDQHYGVTDNSRALDAYAWSFNADSFGMGNRIYSRASIKLASAFSVFGFYSHEVNTSYYNKNRESLNAGLTLDFKNLLNDTLHLNIASRDAKH